MRQQGIRIGMALCMLAVALVIATSYFNGEKRYIITADDAIVLSFGESQTLNEIVLNEDGITQYVITAKVAVSNETAVVNATLTVKIENESEDKTLDIVAFTLYKDGETTPLGSVTGKGQITVTEITKTTTYKLQISLQQKEGRYTAEELGKIGGRMVISFTQGGEDNDEEKLIEYYGYHAFRSGNNFNLCVIQTKRRR